MSKKPDIGSLKREKAVAYINLNYAIDMSDHRATGRTAAGFPRDAKIFWNEMLKQYPQLFSNKNKNRITKERRAPIIDETWLKWHANHITFVKDKIDSSSCGARPLGSGHSAKSAPRLLPGSAPMDQPRRSGVVGRESASLRNQCAFGRLCDTSSPPSFIFFHCHSQRHCPGSPRGRAAELISPPAKSIVRFSPKATPGANASDPSWAITGSD